MTNVEVILRKLNDIKDENTMIAVKSKLKTQEETNEKLTSRAKKIIEDLVKTNTSLKTANEDLEIIIKKLEDENFELKQHCNYYEKTLRKIPKFILRIFLKKDTAPLLNKGKTHGKNIKKTYNNWKNIKI